MIATSFETFLFDLDGVVYVGEEPVPQAASVLHRLRAQGKTLRFLTNDPRPTRQAVAERLRTMGIAAETQEVVTCGWATATHLKTSAAQTAYVVGSDGLCQEIEAAGVAVEDAGEADAVVVGCDEKVAYPHLRTAVRRILQGACFIATNDDPTFPTPNGPAPATGAIVAAVRTATGRAPRVIGKPHPAMFAAALEGIHPEGAVMIGDRLATDVAGARRSGIASLWFNRAGAPSAPDDPPATPDGVITDLTDLFDGDRTAL